MMSVTAASSSLYLLTPVLLVTGLTYTTSGIPRRLIPRILPLADSRNIPQHHTFHPSIASMPTIRKTSMVHSLIWIQHLMTLVTLNESEPKMKGGPSTEMPSGSTVGSNDCKVTAMDVHIVQEACLMGTLYLNWKANPADRHVASLNSRAHIPGIAVF